MIRSEPRRSDLAGVRVFVCFLIVLLSSCVSAPPADTPPESTAPVFSPVKGGRVAVFNFEVKGGGESYASLGSDIPGALAEAFLKGGRLVPVERAELEKILAEQELALSGLVDEATAARIGRLAGAKYALLGSASVIGDQVRLSCRLIDIETAEIVFASSEYGGTKDLYSILDKLASKVQAGSSK